MCRSANRRSENNVFLSEKITSFCGKKIWKYGMQKRVCVNATAGENILYKNTFH
jgi:hypothetical protein